MEHKPITDTYIKDSNVEIVVTNVSTQASSVRKKTDYWSISIIGIIMLALAIYAAARHMAFI